VESIRSYAADFLEQKLPLHVLVNNAGIWAGSRGKTKDGLEVTMGVNWFGPFLLTNLLLDVLKQSQPSRVVLVSSALLANGRLASKDEIEQSLYPKHPDLYGLSEAYSTSKLGNLMHARELAKRLKGSGVSVFALHPGVIKTDLSRNNCCFKCLLGCFSCCLRNTSEGAATTVYCSVAEKLEDKSGEYFQDCRAATAPRNAALNDEMYAALWAKGEELTEKFKSQT